MVKTVIKMIGKNIQRIRFIHLLKVGKIYNQGSRNIADFRLEQLN